MMSVILFLHEHGPSKRMEIYECVSRNGSMPQKFEMLKEHGIIEERQLPEGTVLGLTDSGEMVARCLQNIEEIIG